MSYFRNSVLEAAQNVHISISELTHDESERLLNQVDQNFAKKRNMVWLWEHLKDGVSIRDENAWPWVGEYVGNAEVILFDYAEKDSFFRLQNGLQLVPLLGEMPNAEFYLTNSNAEYVICFNHHDHLIACGTAKSWLEKKITAES